MTDHDSEPGASDADRAQTARTYGAADPIKAGQSGVGFLVNQTSRAFGKAMAKELRQFNIQLPGYVVLRHLTREAQASPDGVSVESLAEKLMLEPAEIEEASERLARDGWLKMTGAGPTARLKPTAKTHKIAPVLSAASRWMLEEALNGFSREEIDQLTALLRRVLTNLEAPLGEDEGPLVR